MKSGSTGNTNPAIRLPLRSRLNSILVIVKTTRPRYLNDRPPRLPLLLRPLLPPLHMYIIPSHRRSPLPRMCLLSQCAKRRAARQICNRHLRLHLPLHLLLPPPTTPTLLHLQLSHRQAHRHRLLKPPKRQIHAVLLLHFLPNPPLNPSRVAMLAFRRLVYVET